MLLQIIMNRENTEDCMFIITIQSQFYNYYMREHLYVPYNNCAVESTVCKCMNGRIGRSRLVGNLFVLFSLIKWTSDIYI